VSSDTIDKVLSGQASSKEAQSVACWFNNPQGNCDLLECIDRDLHKEWDKQYTHPASANTLKHWAWRVACGLLIVIGSLACGYTVYHHYLQPMPVEQQIAYAARGERTQVVLQDGTHIYLNSESQITFPSRFSLKERRIHLEGEAYFEVTKNTHRPFIVEMDHASVTVLGTRFNAQTYANQPVQVTLDEGSVRFSAPDIEDIMLKPGEMVNYDVQLAKAEVKKVALQTAGVWRNHRIEMTNMPLADVIALLERNYNVNFTVHGKKCYQHSFTISMDDYNLKLVLKRLDRLSPLSFKYNEQKGTVDIY